MEQTTTIYLVRHGETEANVTNTIQGQSDVPLNENGRLQARLAGERFGKMPFDVILSSDLSRAAVTARAIGGDREIIYTPELREWDLGAWVGMTLAECAEKYPQEMTDFRSGSLEAQVPEGESRREFFARAERVLQGIISAHPGKTVLCVTHGGVLRAMFNVIFGTSAASRMIRTDNTCFCGFRYYHDRGQWQLLCWNDTAHLEGKALSGGW